MSWLTIVLRIVHIGAGVFWAGATFTFAGFIEPTADAAGAVGGHFIQRLAGSRYVPAMTIAGLLAVGAGIWLFAIDSGGFQPAFMGSRLGVTLSIGGLCGLLAAVFGFGVQGRSAKRMRAVLRAIQGQAGGSTPEQAAQLKGIQQRLRRTGRLTALLLGITVVCMACARYL